MADKDKSIIERAILDAKRIQEALNANTKEILRSVAKEEIDGIVKESLEEGLYEEEDAFPLEKEESEEEESEEEESEEESEEEEGETEEEEEDEDELEDFGSEEGDDLEGDYDGGMDAMTSGDEFEMDMTDASDDDVIAVYKKLTGDDEIEVVYDAEDDELEVKVTEPGDFIVKNVSKGSGAGAEDFGGSGDFGSDEEEELGSDEEMNFDSEEDEDGLEEMMYEITMDNLDESDDDESDDDDDEDDNMEEGVINSLAKEKQQDGLNAYMGQPSIIKSKGNLPESTVSKKALTEAENKYKSLLTEAKELKGRNEEYKTALKTFRTMLAETVVYNSNLTYVTKLFMEHSTTKDEKQTILKRFDEEVSTLKESQRLYKTIVNELSSKAPIKESVDKAIIKEAATGTSKQLNESTAYVDKETSRIMDLMRRVENR